MDLDRIAGLLKAAAHEAEPARLVERIEGHYRKLRIYDGNWVVPELEPLGSTLLPDSISAATLDDFVDATVAAIRDNSYLVAIIDSLDPAELGDLTDKAGDPDTLLALVTFAWCLEQLTRVTRDDWMVIRALQNFWSLNRDRENLQPHYNLFEKAKILTLEKGNVKKFAYVENNEIPPTFGKWFLRINILEAVLEDMRLGFRDNAVAGVPLMMNTSDGQSTISPDQNIVVYSVILPEPWNNLYTAWNLGFTSHYENFPFFFIKLLIPQVNTYRDKPKEYMANRSNALYIYANYVGYERKDIAEGRSKKMDWSCKALSDHFGRINRQSALDYARRVYESDPCARTQRWLRVQERLGA